MDARKAAVEADPRLRRAVAYLRAQYAGLDLSDSERSTLAWLERWEPETVVNVAAVIGKARQAGPYPGDE